MDAVKQGFRVVVAAGGDGTVNEVVNGLAGSDVALGVLPVGTMNVFAAEMGLPNKLTDAWKIIQKRHTKAVDLACANGHYFIQLAGVGLDAQIVKETSWNLKRNFGPLSYVISAAQIAARKPPRLIVEANGTSYEGSFVLIGNGRFYGGPVAFFPNGEIDDGLLDVLVFQNLGYLDIARYLGHVLVGQHTKLSDVQYFQASKLHVSSEDQVPVEADGELAAELPVQFEVAEKKLRVVVPERPVPEGKRASPLVKME